MSIDQRPHRTSLDKVKANLKKAKIKQTARIFVLQTASDGILPVRGEVKIDIGFALLAITETYFVASIPDTFIAGWQLY